MTDVYTRFAMRDGDTYPTTGIGYPAVLRGFPFADDTEIEAMMDALHLIADGELRISVDRLDLGTGPLDFSVFFPPEVNEGGEEIRPERWQFEFPWEVALALQDALGVTVTVEWIENSRAFRFTSKSSGWQAHISFATGGMAGTDISPVLQLTENTGASVAQGRVVASGSETSAGIEFPYGDWVFEPPDLVNDEGLETAVVISLLTDALAAADDPLPGIAEDDRRGWWAQPWGSKLWLLSREKWTEDVKVRAEYYARISLQWMIEDEVADRIETEARLTDMGTIVVAVAIYRDGRLLFAKPFGILWQATMNYTPQITRQ